jgi:hypothetical protein
MYFDSSFGAVLVSPKGVWLLYVIQQHLCAKTNAAEYEDLINGLRIATEVEVQWLYIHGSSSSTKSWGS